MLKLTHTQRVILAAAAKRTIGAVLPLPKSLKLKGGAASSTLKSLIKKGLIDEKPAARNAATWREAEDGWRLMLVITDSGLKTISAERAHESRKQAATSEARPKKRGRHSAGKGVNQNPKAETGRTTRPGTKQALLIDLLRRPKGATIADLTKATAWQPHSLHGAISGTLKKKLGLAVSSEKSDGRGRVYRIAERS